MIRRPPRSTLTDTLFPFTTLFRADPTQQVLEPGRRGDPDLEDVGLLPRDRPAGLDLSDRRQPLRVVVGLGRVDRGDRHEGSQRQPGLVVVDGRAVTLDHAARLETLHPLFPPGRGPAGKT